ncbi:hypothetical protein M9H77_14228 [Catharanthus roseus]|uniref:Uncharacterized protein n=1 Tax=Catharanthus roseus TaxID=4058 RepID=A0ACC0BMF5_CATRO|nr:hypothetical protein M9H77_14228 [Catharanthus roseus]
MASVSSRFEKKICLWLKGKKEPIYLRNSLLFLQLKLKFYHCFCATAAAVFAPTAIDSAASVSPTVAAEVYGFYFNYNRWLSCFCFNISLIYAASLRSFLDLLRLSSLQQLLLYFSTPSTASTASNCCVPATASNVYNFCLF